MNTSGNTQELSPEILEQANALRLEGVKLLDNGSIEEGIALTEAAIKMLCDAAGDMHIETARFYYSYADALVCKVESSTDPLDFMGAANSSIVQNKADLKSLVAGFAAGESE